MAKKEPPENSKLTTAPPYVDAETTEDDRLLEGLIDRNGMRNFMIAFARLLELRPDLDQEIPKGSPPHVCAFCSKRREQVENLIAGPEVCICTDCVAQCNEVIARGEEDKGRWQYVPIGSQTKRH